MSDREFLFEYGFRGDTWGITIHAKDLMEAREKIQAVTFARYKGEVAAKIKVPGDGMIRRLTSALLGRNET